MAPAAGFAEVLDGYVGRFEPADVPAAGRWPAGVATPPLFWFDGPGPVARAAAPSRPPRVEGRPAAAPPPRPRRTLAPAHQAALDHLVAHGARIDAAFTRDDLRRAFRALARAYHPDRHPGLAADGVARLSTIFANLRASYDLLKTLV